MTNESIRLGFNLMKRVEYLDVFLRSRKLAYLRYDNENLCITLDNAPEVFAAIQKYKERLEKELEDL